MAPPKQSDQTAPPPIDKQRLHINISEPLLSWFDVHGRKDLPWQHDINPYRVWISEIMLQQTQVSTVIDYFNRFMAELPTLEMLANADEDLVLHLWTGLGYYTRARNLHKTAKLIFNEYNGQLPDTVDALCELPGIGRSTAGAIVSIAFRQQAAILDGNVKRVLARLHAVDGWPGKAPVAKQLWEFAEAHTPKSRVADYSQAMMDLGATLCTRSKPECPCCPLKKHCKANKLDSQHQYPGKKPTKTLPIKQTQMLIIKNPQGEVLLEKRPPSGIWGGLWAFPELTLEQNHEHYCLDVLGFKADNVSRKKTLRHTFSHYHLDITPIIVELNTPPKTIMEANRQLWYNLQQPVEIGMAAPIKKLLNALQ